MRRTHFLSRKYAGRDNEIKRTLLAAIDMIESVPMARAPTTSLPAALQHLVSDIEQSRPELNPREVSTEPAPREPTSLAVVPEVADLVEVIENGRKVTVHAELAKKLERQKRLSASDAESLSLPNEYPSIILEESPKDECSECGLQEGDPLEVSDGNGKWFPGVVTSATSTEGILVAVHGGEPRAWSEWRVPRFLLEKAPGVGLYAKKEDR